MARTVQVMVRLTPKELELLQVAAELEGVPTAALLRGTALKQVRKQHPHLLTAGGAVT